MFRSREYSAFRSSVAQKKVTVSGVEWIYYDAGPKTIDTPIVFMPPICGTADIYYKQMLSLSALQYRVVSVELPVVWEVQTFCQLFGELLNFLNFSKVHIFGASLGGFLGMKFAEYTHAFPRVHSLILCNAFADTAFFHREHIARSFWLCPVGVLRSIISRNIHAGSADDMSIVRSVAFMMNRLNQLNQKQLASRLKLNCAESYVQPHLINHLPVTLLDVFDVNALTDEVRNNLYKCFPESKKAHLKSGGNFPYLSRASDVNLHIQIHLREFMNSRFAARKSVEVEIAVPKKEVIGSEDSSNGVTEQTSNGSDENSQHRMEEEPVAVNVNGLVSSIAEIGDIPRFDGVSVPLYGNNRNAIDSDDDEPS